MEVRKKEFTYRGKAIEELKAMDIREFAKLLKSRQKRAILRDSQSIEKFISRSNKKISKNKPIKTHQREMIIVPKMIGMKIQVYNGQKFIPFEVIGEMIGHRLGEFSPTRSKVTHGSAGIGATKGSKHKSKK